MRRSLALLTCITALFLAGCGGGSSGGTTPTAGSTSSSPPAAVATAPADEAAAKAEITANWTKFFAYRTPPATAQTLLENGDQMAATLAFARREQAQTHIRQAVKVKIITFNSATQAVVIYALLNGTQVLLPSASGVAVYVDGTWKVSKQTFCTLVQLGANGKTVPGCS